MQGASIKTLNEFAWLAAHNDQMRQKADYTEVTLRIWADEKNTSIDVFSLANEMFERTVFRVME